MMSKLSRLVWLPSRHLPSLKLRLPPLQMLLTLTLSREVLGRLAREYSTWWVSSAVKLASIRARIGLSHCSKIYCTTLTRRCSSSVSVDLNRREHRTLRFSPTSLSQIILEFLCTVRGQRWPRTWTTQATLGTIPPWIWLISTIEITVVIESLTVRKRSRDITAVRLITMFAVNYSTRRRKDWRSRSHCREQERSRCFTRRRLMLSRQSCARDPRLAPLNERLPVKKMLMRSKGSLI